MRRRTIIANHREAKPHYDFTLSTDGKRIFVEDVDFKSLENQGLAVHLFRYGRFINRMTDRSVRVRISNIWRKYPYLSIGANGELLVYIRESRDKTSDLTQMIRRRTTENNITRWSCGGNSKWCANAITSVAVLFDYAVAIGPEWAESPDSMFSDLHRFQISATKTGNPRVKV